MCGIVGAVARRDVPAILIEGLRRLEYRGYDSAGLAVIVPGERRIERRRAVCLATNAATNDRSKVTAIYACKPVSDGCRGRSRRALRWNSTACDQHAAR